MDITLKKVQDSVSEKKLIEDNVCTFVVLDRSTPTRPLLFISTKSDDTKLANLPMWTPLLQGGKDQLKRFSVRLSKEDFCQQLKDHYHEGKVKWVE